MKLFSTRSSAGCSEGKGDSFCSKSRLIGAILFPAAAFALQQNNFIHLATPFLPGAFAAANNLNGWRMVIFLDIDGVLHTCDSTAGDLFRHAPRFSVVLRSHPNIEVVISSDWRKDAGDAAELALHFDIDVRHRFIGLTGVDSDPIESRRRERECWQWLCAHGRERERWIAIDDWPENFGSDLPGAGAVLFTDPSLGFDDEAAAILRTMIAEQTPTTRFCYDRATLCGWPLWNV